MAVPGGGDAGSPTIEVVSGAARRGLCPRSRSSRSCGERSWGARSGCGVGKYSLGNGGKVAGSNLVSDISGRTSRKSECSTRACRSRTAASGRKQGTSQSPSSTPVRRVPAASNPNRCARPALGQRRSEPEVGRCSRRRRAPARARACARWHVHVQYECPWRYEIATRAWPPQR